MTKKIVVLNTKGGTGKSMITINIAHQLSKDFKVGIADCDIDSSNIPSMLGIHKRVELSTTDRNFIPEKWNGIKIMATGLLYEGTITMFKTGPENMQIIKDILRYTKWGNLDYLVIDSPAGSSDELRAISDVIGVDNIVGAVLVAHPSNVEDCIRVWTICTMTGIRMIGVIENMAGVICSVCGSKIICKECGNVIDPFGSHNNGVKKFAEDLDIPYLGSIPLISFEKHNPILPENVDGPVREAVKMIKGEEDGNDE